MKPFAMIGWLCGLMSLPAGAVFGQAAAGADNLLLTVATTTKHAPGSKWAYIAWLSSNPRVLSRHSFAVYRKPGAANAAVPYQRVAIVTAQTDERNIRALLRRAEAMHPDPALPETIRQSFSTILPDGSALTLEARVAALIRGALDSVDVYDNLTLLAQRHPAINLCRGHAYAARIPAGLTTFEIRQIETGTMKELGVIGRVTVDGDADPVLLPAPGAPVEVPLDRPNQDDTLNAYRDQLAQKELHLATRLRWGAPVELLRLSALQSGYDLFRVRRQYAESRSWNQTPPTAAELHALDAADGGRANRLPIFTEADLSVQQAADLADKTTAFFTDDRDGPLQRFVAGAEPFRNGEQYYYFVCARDLLGRDGAVSRGTPVTILDRFGSMPPPKPRVLNVYNFRDGEPQRLKIEWDAPKQPLEGALVFYHVYRWRNVDEIYAQPGNVANGRVRADLIPREWVDTGIGAAQANTNWFYTVRAEYRTPLHGGGDHSVFTGHSAPGFGVLRDRQGPAPAAGGGITVKCYQAICSYTGTEVVQDAANPDKDLWKVELKCLANSPDLEFAEFYVGDQLLARREFANGAAVAAPLEFSLAELEALDAGNGKVFCRVGGRGVISSKASRAWADVIPGSAASPGVTGSGTINVTFAGGLNRIECQPEPNGDPPPHLVGIDRDLTLTFTTTVGTAEWKVYRRVDAGPLVFIARGEPTDRRTPEVVVLEDAETLSGFTCYFVQFFDEHGNPGPMKEIACIHLPPSRISVPVLSPLAPDGTDDDRSMTVTWFCPPYGVDHFEVLVARKGDPEPSATFEPVLSANLNVDVDAIDHETGESFGVYRTDRVRGRLSGNAASPPSAFSLTLPVSGGNFLVAVRAVAVAGNNAYRGDYSNIETLGWVPRPEPSGLVVPWPARPLPPVRAAMRFSSLCVAGQLAASFRGNTVRIGELNIGTAAGGVVQPLPDKLFGVSYDQRFDPNRGLYHLAGDTNLPTVFPCVLYRYRVTEQAFDDPALEAMADVVQVSPRIDGIAYRFADNPERTEVPDPYVLLEPKQEPGPLADTDILLVDRHPIIRGARYRYLLTRFDPRTGEIDAIYHTNITDPIQ